VLRSNFVREAFSWHAAELMMKVVFTGQSGRRREVEPRLAVAGTASVVRVPPASSKRSVRGKQAHTPLVAPRSL